jgi:diacylglycerol kinase family enzyme
VGSPPASVALIANPASGGGTDPELIAGLLRSDGVEVRFGSHAAADRIVVASGDGGIAPAAAAAARAGVPLAVIPVGTANDFARGRELPCELEAAARLAATGTSQQVLDLGWMDARPFVNAVSAGLAASAGATASGLKSALGPLSYLAGAVWAGLSDRPLRCSLLVDGAPFFEGRAWQATVAGTGSFGAGSELAPADPSDGLLDVAVMEAGSRLRLARHAYGLRSGRLTDQPGVRHARGAAVELTLADSATLNVDGELVSGGPHVRLTVEPSAFALVVPDQPGADSPLK